MPAGRPRKPLAMSTGHITSEQRAEKEAIEASVSCPVVEFETPPYLEDESEVARFLELKELLKSVDEQMCTALDADQLARYVMCEGLFTDLSRQLKSAVRKRDASAVADLQRRQDTAFKQVQACAAALGLNVASRMRLDLRKPAEPKPENPFARFGS